ncbi:MarR family winged helix-turn-helix transcriptional regulator [Propylenella binzhouense]|uniref:MarR family transcriptional regulator n=1 Tax=Propylenella binzhouense TaxID=2555902 RepID=A0A964T8K6_9HYPH|nr:MarR family transcriptional regulator [Propylenella binzhouense]MYZ49754.1 MarR family transcriptional regulator [Propylenella binzhouense]
MSDTTIKHSLGFLITDAHRLLRRRFEEKARGTGLTATQWQMLARLSHNEGINQVRLAQLLEVEPMTLCRLVDRMEEAGWVAREPDPGDRRARLLYLTDKTRGQLGAMREVAREVYAEALAGISPEVRAIVTEALCTLIRNLSEREAVLGEDAA